MRHYANTVLSEVVTAALRVSIRVRKNNFANVRLAKLFFLVRTDLLMIEYFDVPVGLDTG